MGLFGAAACAADLRDETAISERILTVGIADIIRNECPSIRARVVRAVFYGEAYGAVKRPALLRKLKDPVKVSPDVIEQAFLEANPGLRANQLAVTCRDGLIRAVRICLSKALVPRTCSLAVERGCRAKSATLPPMR